MWSNQKSKPSFSKAKESPKKIKESPPRSKAQILFCTDRVEYGQHVVCEQIFLERKVQFKAESPRGHQNNANDLMERNRPHRDQVQRSQNHNKFNLRVAPPKNNFKPYELAKNSEVDIQVNVSFNQQEALQRPSSHAKEQNKQKDKKKFLPPVNKSVGNFFKFTKIPCEQQNYMGQSLKINKKKEASDIQEFLKGIFENYAIEATRYIEFTLLFTKQQYQECSQFAEFNRQKQLLSELINYSNHLKRIKKLESIHQTKLYPKLRKIFIDFGIPQEKIDVGIKLVLSSDGVCRISKRVRPQREAQFQSQVLKLIKSQEGDKNYKRLQLDITNWRQQAKALYIKEFNSILQDFKNQKISPSKAKNRLKQKDAQIISKFRTKFQNMGVSSKMLQLIQQQGQNIRDQGKYFQNKFDYLIAKHVLGQTQSEDEQQPSENQSDY